MRRPAPSILPRLSALSARLTRAAAGPAPFGVGGGAAQQVFDATAGGIKGRVNVLLQGVQNQGDDVAQTINVPVPFQQSDQDRIGSIGRTLDQVFFDIAVSGDLPAGYDANSLRRFLIAATYIEIEVGGVPELQFPLAAAVDTQKIDRSFKLRAILCPGRASSFVYRWRSDANTLPLASGGIDPEYQARLLIMSVFSPPLLSNERAAA